MHRSQCGRAGSTSVKASTSGGATAPSPWYLRINWTATIWVLFLLIPLGITVLSDMALWRRACGIVGLLGFIVYYAYAVTEREGWDTVPAGATVWSELRRSADVLAVLACLAALTLPALNWWAFYTLPFFCAYILFSTRLRTGILSVLALCVAANGASLVWAQGPTARWTVLGCSLSAVSISAARGAEELRERRTAAERELATAEQREEIGRDVHDLLGHSLTVLTLKTEVARRLISRDPAAAERELDEVIALSRSALADVRGTVTRLRTPDLASQVAASRTALRAAEVSLEVEGSVGVVPERQRALFAWALREATTNVVRHAGASRVRVELGPGLLRVADDGVGLGSASPGNGLSGLRSRAETDGGSLTLRSPAWGEAGTELEVRLP